LIVRKISMSLCVLFTGIVLVSGARSAAQPVSLDERLADRNYRIGAQVDLIVDYRIDGWKYVDSMHLIMLDESSRSYLVTLMHKCTGLHKYRITVLPSTRDQLVPNDKLLTRRQGRTLDHCYVKAIYELEQIE
jgi:hypothetical protein